MVNNADKAFDQGMDLIRNGSSPPTPAASSAGASSPAIPANMTSVDWFGLNKGQKGSTLSKSGPQPPWPSATSTSTAGGSMLGSSQSQCRPWDRGDLLKRLSTFNSSNWLIVPKVHGPLACARRGWVNVDGDLITCDSCGVHLKFPILSLQHDDDLAAKAYAEQLDTGHKVLCPWRGNQCAESLVQFPPSNVSALIGGFKDRCDALLQFSVLPVICGSAIDQMKLTRGSEIDRLLAKPLHSMGGEAGKRAEDGSGIRLGSMDAANNPYCQALRLISLCGWEPRFLPYVVDCEEHSAYSTRKAQSVNPGEGPSHRMRERSMLLPSQTGRLDKQFSGQNTLMVSELRRDPTSAVLDCSLCGATAGLWSYITSARPTPLISSALMELPEPPQKYTEAPMHGVSAASGVEGWHTIETPLKGKEDIREEGVDAAITGEQRMSSHNGALGLNMTVAGGSSPTVLESFLAELPFTGPAADCQQFVRQPEGSEMGFPVASYESFGPGVRGCRMDDGGSTVDRPQSRMQRADSIEGTVVDLEGDEVDDGEVGRKRSYVGESSKGRRGGENSAADQLSYGLAFTDPGCSNFIPSETDFEVDNADRLKKNRREAIWQELYDQRILPQTPARNSVYSSSVIAVDTSYSKRENSMESVENIPQDSDVQGTALSERIDHEELYVLEQAQQSTCHQGNAGDAHGGPSDPGNSTSEEGGGDIAVENDAAVFSGAIGMGRGVSTGMSGGSVQMGVSHEAEIHGTDLSVHRMESITNDTELITEVTEVQRQTSESVRDQVPAGHLVVDDTEQTNAQDNATDSLEAVPSLSVAIVHSDIKRGDSGQGESCESEQKGKPTIQNDHIMDLHDAYNTVVQSGEGGKELHLFKSVVAEPGVTGAGSAAAHREGKRLVGKRRSREQGGEFDPIRQHHHYCPWVNGYVAAAGSGEGNLKVALCGWQVTIDAVDEFQMQNCFFAAPMESESAASMHKDNGLDACKLHGKSSQTKKHQSSCVHS